MARGLDQMALDVARARLRIGNRAEAGRTGARRRGAIPALDAGDPTLLFIAADEGRRATILKNAAAAFHAHEIAQAIRPAARRIVTDVTGEASRAFALRHRKAAGAVAGDGTFADRFAETLAQMDRGLMARLGGREVTGAIGQCLSAALEEAGI